MLSCKHSNFSYFVTADTSNFESYVERTKKFNGRFNLTSAKCMGIAVLALVCCGLHGLANRTATTAST